MRMKWSIARRIWYTGLSLLNSSFWMVELLAKRTEKWKTERDAEGERITKNSKQNLFQRKKVKEIERNRKRNRKQINNTYNIKVFFCLLSSGSFSLFSKWNLTQILSYCITKRSYALFHIYKSLFDWDGSMIYLLLEKETHMLSFNSFSV